MRYFDNGNKVRQDACALETRSRENQSFIDYNTFNFYQAGRSCSKVEQDVQSLANEYPNMRFRVGYGVASACTIETDNKLRYGFDLTHGPERQNLSSRNFVAGPDFSRGQSVPQVESILLNGEDTINQRDCYKLAELPFAVFQPMHSCVESFVKGASSVIGDDIRMGKPSKDIFLSSRKETC